MQDIAECRPEIINPCNINDLYDYCKNTKNYEDNEYISALYGEMKRLNYNHVNKKIISSVFQLTRYYSDIDYIDIGCAILSFIAEDHNCKNVFFDLRTGNIGISDTKNLPDNKKIEDLCNNIKQIIIQKNIGT